MTKGPSPLLGYNTNVRHKGRVFHIQTEDSGVNHPHVMTHLFADGGRILKSTKTTYSELVGVPDMAVLVKKIMQDQHKAMFIALRDGQFDHLFDASVPDKAGPSVSGDLVSQALSAPSEPAPAPPSSPASALPPAPSADQGTASRPALQLPSLRATATATPVRPSSPPARPTGASGHYQAVRSPEILSSFRGKPEGTPANIFGDGLMSEKSLDEVILAYLAEDLDEPAS
ncbi:MAG: hypothetical protein Q8Q09_27565 [Deltaproteobacteria bacterium]|nr:hypothetical protein [Deltaproteobacteria bacterium]